MKLIDVAKRELGEHRERMTAHSTNDYSQLHLIETFTEINYDQSRVIAKYGHIFRWLLMFLQRKTCIGIRHKYRQTVSNFN